jgi:hypothetical protein
MNDLYRGQTIRTVDGRGRAEYDPQWSPSLPWIVFYDGTQLINKASPEAVKSYFRDRFRVGVKPYPWLEKSGEDAAAENV